MAIDLELKWDRLNAWLQEDHSGYQANVIWKEVPGAGRGLFTTKKIEPGGTLLSIPSTALLNPLTLSDKTSIPAHLWPRPVSGSSKLRPKRRRLLEEQTNSSPRNGLNTTQCLTLHLLLTRDPEGRHPTPWRAYVDTLPQTFWPWHPLTWVVTALESDSDLSIPSPGGKGKRNPQRRQWWLDLVACLSSGARAKLDDVVKRYSEDILLLKKILREEEPFKSQNLIEKLSTNDYLWSWLNVNTRTVSIPLNLPPPNHLNNHTLVPILDFANHSSDPLQIIPRPVQFSSSSSIPAQFRTQSVIKNGKRSFNAHLVPGKIGFDLIAPDRGMEEGEEVKFEYGGHSNAVLFAEYGFRDGGLPPEEGCEDSKGWLKTLRYGEVDLNVLIERFWDYEQNLGDRDRSHEDRNTLFKTREIKEDVLRSINCLGQNTISASPYPPHPSYPLLMTLRVIHYPLSTPPTTVQTHKMDAIKSGSVSFISQMNEEEVMKTLSEMSAEFEEGCRNRLTSLKDLMGRIESSFESRHKVAGAGEIQHDKKSGDGDHGMRSDCEGMRDGVKIVEAMCREELGIMLAFHEVLRSGRADYTR